MVFIIGMFFSFSTFGQRCATVYSSDKYTDSKVEEIERFLKISTKNYENIWCYLYTYCDSYCI